MPRSSNKNDTKEKFTNFLIGPAALAIDGWPNIYTSESIVIQPGPKSIGAIWCEPVNIKRYLTRVGTDLDATDRLAERMMRDGKRTAGRLGNVEAKRFIGPAALRLCR